MPVPASSNVADRLHGLHENLSALALALGDKLDSDSLAKLNACVTELQSLSEGSGGSTNVNPTHAPMEPPPPTVANPPKADTTTKPPTPPNKAA
jgi:hypothetical protein